MARSKLTDTEVTRARFGPREMKDPRSREYAIQTIYALKTYVQMKRADEERVTRELDEIRKYKHWKVLGYESEDALLEAEVGMARKAIVTKLAKQARENPAQNHGGDRKNNQADNIRLNDYGTSRSYILRRLARDHPKLLSEVEAGHMTPRGAAIKAGIITPPTALDLLQRAWTKASESQRQQFLTWIEQEHP